ncbi:MAG TPA: glycosyltransferase [Verrucomicrobiae bacterium]|nr:glycosyltransferase [Verrucomicrobiae bacterium]
MKVALITPHYVPATRGNSVTVRRIARHLSAAGCAVEVLSRDTLDEAEIRLQVAAASPDVVHCFHALSTGPLAMELAAAAGVPLVVTFTGTDAYQALEGESVGEVRRVVEAASVVVVFHDSIRRRLLRFFPSAGGKISVIPQGVEVPAASGGPRGGTETLFFLPAGLRPVKNVTFALEPLERLARRHPLRFLVAGPALDAAYAADSLQAMQRFPFAHYAGEVEHEGMGELYRQSDVVLNTSFSEGGMANSVLEAFAWGRCVLASDIEGNRSLVREGVTGLLYASEEEFAEKAGLLLREPELRRELGENGLRLVPEKHSPQGEAAAYLEVYRRVKGEG